MKTPKQEVNQIWYMKDKKRYSNDINVFYKSLIKMAKLKGFNVKVLGKIQDLPIFLLTGKTNSLDKNIGK